MIEIKRAFTGELLHKVDGDSLHDVDLRDVNLRGADLSELDLTGADLSGCQLRSSEMNEVILEHANLAGANMLLANLRSANLRYANMESAILEGAGLLRADLRGTNLTGVNLFGVQLSQAKYNYQTQWPSGFDPEKNGARLVKEEAGDDEDTQRLAAEEKLRCPSCDEEIYSDALKCRHCGEWVTDSTQQVQSGVAILGGGGELLFRHPGETLEGADLTRAHLAGANLMKVNIRRANFKGVDLARAQLKGAQAQEADFTDTNVSGVNLREANLTDAKFTSAVMRGTNMSGACLVRTDFEEANLKDACFEGADLADADLFGANLYGANLKGINYTKRTQWPKGFNPVQNGAPRIDGVSLGDTKYPLTKGAQIKCPFCAEMISPDAQKCRHCGEWLTAPPEGFNAAPELVEELARMSGNSMKMIIGGGVAVAACIAFVTMIFITAFGHNNQSAKGYTRPAEPPKISEGYALNFPTEIGVISARPWGADELTDWDTIGPAEGEVPVPSGKELKLIVSSDDLSALKTFSPGDLYALDLSYSMIEDDDLANITDLAGLHELALPPSITDEGLSHLRGLRSLKALNLLQTQVTDAGLSHLKDLRKLEFLIVPSTVSEAGADKLLDSIPNLDISHL